MFVSIFIFALLHSTQSACITFEKGEAYAVYYQACQNGLQFKTTISFSQKFCAPPKILIHSVYYQRQLQSSFSFQILTITATNFQVQIQCDSITLVNYVYFYWVALTGKQILILNDFMQQITLIDGYRTGLIPYPIQNVDYEISTLITSYSGGSPNITVEKQVNSFNLYVTGVNSAQLKGLGVQIMAGLKSVYTFFQSQSVNCSYTGSFQIITPLTPTQIPIVVYQNNYMEITTLRSLTNYLLASSSGTCYQGHNVIYNLYIYECTYKPHYYKKIRVSNMMSLDYILMGSFDTQMLHFQETNQTWIDSRIPITDKLEYNQGIISLVYYHSCQPGRKIIVTILRQGKQGVYDYTYDVYCHRLYNLITMHIQLLQQHVAVSELEISLTDKGVQLQEKSINTGDTYQLVNIQY